MSGTNEISGLALREAVAVKVMKLPNVRVAPDSVWSVVHEPTPEQVAEYGRHGVVNDYFPVPAYESDPAACAAMEARIKELELEVEYTIALRLECAPCMYEPLDILMACIFATPEQRCRAALAAMESK